MRTTSELFDTVKYGLDTGVTEIIDAVQALETLCQRVADLECERERLEQLLSTAFSTLRDISKNPTVSRAVKELIHDAGTKFRTINDEFKAHDTP